MPWRSRQVAWPAPQEAGQLGGLGQLGLPRRARQIGGREWISNKFVTLTYLCKKSARIDRHVALVSYGLQGNFATEFRQPAILDFAGEVGGEKVPEKSARFDCPGPLILSQVYGNFATEFRQAQIALKDKAWQGREFCKIFGSSPKKLLNNLDSGL